MSKHTDQAQRSWAFRTIVAMAATVVIALSIPLLDLPSPELSENRVLATLPSTPRTFPETVAAFPAVNAYLEDHFPLRSHAISSLNYVRYKLGYSTLSQVVVGPNGWLFHDNGATIDYHMGNSGLSDRDYPILLSELDAYRERLREDGTLFYVLAAPLKSSVYPEEMPNWLRKGSLDAEAMSEMGSSTTPFIYPAAQIRSANTRTYGAYDTHWNAYGAYAAYRLLIERIGVDLESVGAANDFDQFQSTDLPAWAVPRDLALMLGIAGMVSIDHPSKATIPQHDESLTEFLSDRTDWTSPQVIRTNAKTGLTLLLARDSFSLELLPFLKRHFSMIILTHVQDGFIRDDMVRYYRPDVSIIQVQEAGLQYLKGIFPAN